MIVCSSPALLFEVLSEKKHVKKIQSLRPSVYDINNFAIFVAGVFVIERIGRYL
jgi:hypothetical protein